MQQQTIDEIYRAGLDTAAKIIGRGDPFIPVLILNPRQQNHVTISLEEYFARFGTTATFQAMASVCKEENIDAVIYVTEAWAATLDKDVCPEEALQGREVVDMPDKYEILLIQIETRSEQWCWRHPILTDDSGARFIDTDQKVDPTLSKDINALSLLYDAKTNG